MRKRCGTKKKDSVVRPLLVEKHLRIQFPSSLLSQTLNATGNEAGKDKSEFTRRTKATNISQQQPINILKPLLFVCR